MVAKAGLGIIGLSAISVGGVALAKPHLLGMDHMPEYHSLDKDKDYNTTYSGEDKFGKKYGKYLAGVSKETSDNGQDGKEHKDWWEWALRRLRKVKAPSGKFSNENVTDFYNESNGKALNQVCKKAYETEDKDNNFDENDNNGSKFKKSDVWKYCSIGGTQPQTIKEFNTKNNGNQETYNSDSAIAKENSEQEKLLSINSPNNDWIWDLKDKEFRNTTIEGNGYFKKEKDKNNNERKTLKEICKWAYGQKPVGNDGDTKLEKTDVTKYCSLEGK